MISPNHSLLISFIQAIDDIVVKAVAAAVKQIQGNSDLKALVAVYEVPYEPPASGGCCGGSRGRINYEARVILKEEVKVLVRDAYVCYKIGQKLVEALHRDETTRKRRNRLPMKQLRERSEGSGA
ncbi:hypothetical protein Nepgr_008443 [Nepenthes gracilis]|uniref:Uncharacterized protein n=1 Tax=Nepenthes gracilis TaxID=150966 RepID=A0AAD3S8Q5_NEPGR|nr:hypothetical protein Nepgr_008443 [Nepenthes gracilis]